MHDDVNAEPPLSRAAPAGLRVHTTQDGHAVVVRPHGEIDLRNAGTLQDAVDRALATGAHEIVVDLASCTFIDSSGLALLVGLSDALKDDADRRLQVRPGPPQVQRVFELTGLDRLFFFSPS